MGHHAIVPWSLVQYCRWGEVSGKHIELRVGDIVDFDFLAGVFKVSMTGARRQQDACCLQPCASRPGSVWHQQPISPCLTWGMRQYAQRAGLVAAAGQAAACGRRLTRDTQHLNCHCCPQQPLTHHALRMVTAAELQAGFGGALWRAALRALLHDRPLQGGVHAGTTTSSAPSTCCSPSRRVAGLCLCSVRLAQALMLHCCQWSMGRRLAQYPVQHAS